MLSKVEKRERKKENMKFLLFRYEIILYYNAVNISIF